MINRDQLIQELAAQFYINKDRVTAGWGVPDPNVDKSELRDYPDPNRQWYVYRDEWFALSDSERQVWLNKAEDWLEEWEGKYTELYDLLLNYGKSVFSAP